MQPLEQISNLSRIEDALRLLFAPPARKLVANKTRSSASGYFLKTALRLNQVFLPFFKVVIKVYPDRWMPAADIKNRLGLMLLAVPVQNEQYGPKGWLFATLMRTLEDRNLVEFKKEDNNRTYYRSR